MEPNQNAKMQVEDEQAVSYSRKQTYQDISWETVFEGSKLKCERCLNSIRRSVLREYTNMIGKGLEETSDWSIKIAIEAKQLANDPTWFCNHPPDETYFVSAILKGVKKLLENSKENLFIFEGEACIRRSSQAEKNIFLRKQALTKCS